MQHCRRAAMRPGELGPLASGRKPHPAAEESPGSCAGAAQMRADFIDFYDRERARVVVFLMNCGASRQAAEDAMQDAVTDAWALTGSGRWAEIDCPPAWIRAVALRRDTSAMT